MYHLQYTAQVLLVFRISIDWHSFCIEFIVIICVWQKCVAKRFLVVVYKDSSKPSPDKLRVVLLHCQIGFRNCFHSCAKMSTHTFELHFRCIWILHWLPNLNFSLRYFELCIDVPSFEFQILTFAFSNCIINHLSTWTVFLQISIVFFKQDGYPKEIGSRCKFPVTNLNYTSTTRPPNAAQPFGRHPTKAKIWSSRTIFDPNFEFRQCQSAQ